MWKVFLIMLAGFLCMLWLIMSADSKDYWESVGPRWDRMLNPCKYEECK